MKHHILRAYRNKAFFYGLLPILMIVAALGLALLRVETIEAPSTNTQSVDVEPETAITTKQDLRTGWEARQANFEAIDPQYPDSEGINYTVANGQLQGDVDEADQFLWDIIASLAPTDESKNAITDFFVYFDEEDDTLAYVESTDDPNASWTFGINYLAVNTFEDFVPTVVHEYGHIVSLQDSQTTVEVEQPDIRDTCSTYLVDEGCLNDGSFLSDFYQQFWTEPGFDIQRDRTADESLKFFEQNPDVFVSDYATTNPVEDFAETLMTYVIEDIDDPDALASDKLDFIANYTEFASYRLSARELIAAWGQ